MMNNYTEHRELTHAERTAIKKLVKKSCANYDCKYGCLQLDDACYMFYGVGYTNTGMCKYFRESVLPTDPALENVLTGNTAVKTRSCPICGGTFTADGKKVYCSDACTQEAHRRRNRENMRKTRSN